MRGYLLQRSQGTKLDFFYSSWKYLIVFVLDQIFSQDLIFFIPFEADRNWGPASMNLDIPFEIIVAFSNNEKASKTISIVIIFVREYNKSSTLILKTSKATETLVRLVI